MAVGEVGRVVVGCSLVSQPVIAGPFDSHGLVMVEAVAVEDLWEHRTSPFPQMIFRGTARGFCNEEKDKDPSFPFPPAPTTRELINWWRPHFELRSLLACYQDHCLQIYTERRLPYPFS